MVVVVVVVVMVMMVARGGDYVPDKTGKSAVWPRQLRHYFHNLSIGLFHIIVGIA